jgi:hypothetical protein
VRGVAEDERVRILARANGGRAEAKKRGVKFGPKPKLASHQGKEVVRMVHGEGKSLRAVAHHYDVGHSTIVRALERGRQSRTVSTHLNDLCASAHRPLPCGNIYSSLHCRSNRRLSVSLIEPPHHKRSIGGRYVRVASAHAP